MRDIIHFSEPRNKNQFRINYPYYGLFGTADVTEIINSSETVLRCRLLNGTIDKEDNNNCQMGRYKP